MKTDKSLQRKSPASTPKWCLFLHGLIVELACSFILLFLLMALIVGGFAIAGAFVGIGRELGKEVLHFLSSNVINPTFALIYAAIVIGRFSYRWRKNSKSDANKEG